MVEVLGWPGHLSLNLDVAACRMATGANSRRAQEVQHSNRDCRGGGGRVRGVGVVVAAAAALLLAGVDGDAIADVARVGRPADA
jgi:hypothetical protein